MAPKKMGKETDPVIVQSALVIKGKFLSDFVFLPTTNQGGKKWVKINAQERWIRQLFTGKIRQSRSDEKITTIVNSVKDDIKDDIHKKREMAKKKLAQEDEDLRSLARAQREAVMGDDSATADMFSDDEEEAQGSPNKKRKHESTSWAEIQCFAFDINLDEKLGKEFGTFQVQNYTKSINIEATAHAVLAIVEMLSQRKKQLDGIEVKPITDRLSWREKQQADGVTIPRVQGKVHFNPSQKSWAVTYQVTEYSDEKKVLTRGLHISETSDAGNKLSSAEYLQAVKDGFRSACEKWNFLDKSRSTRLEFTDYLNKD